MATHYLAVPCVNHRGDETVRYIPLVNGKWYTNEGVIKTESTSEKALAQANLAVTAGYFGGK